MFLPEGMDQEAAQTVRFALLLPTVMEERIELQ
jgi:hypothetical protein